MKPLRQYEIPLLVTFYTVILVQLIYKPKVELLVIPIFIFGLLIWGYVHEVKRKSISIALILSTSFIISLYLTAKGLEAQYLFFIGFKISFGLVAILLFIEANKLRSSLSEISYSLILALSLLLMLSVFSPRIIFGSFETSWLRYIASMLAAHVFINERNKSIPTITIQLKIVLIIYSLPILADIKKILVSSV